MNSRFIKLIMPLVGHLNDNISLKPLAPTGSPKKGSGYGPLTDEEKVGKIFQNMSRKY